MCYRLQGKAGGRAGVAGGKLGSAAGRAGERAVPEQWKGRGELVKAAVNTEAWIAVMRSTEQQWAPLAAMGKGSKVRGTKATEGGMLKCEHVEHEGDGARAGSPFILNLGRGRGGSGRGGGGAESACAVRRK